MFNYQPKSIFDFDMKPKLNLMNFSTGNNFYDQKQDYFQSGPKKNYKNENMLQFVNFGKTQNWQNDNFYLNQEQEQIKPMYVRNGIPEVILTSSKKKCKVDYDEVRKEIKAILAKPGFDDGSIGPFLVRLAWHASGTYDKESKTGGSDGATMRFDLEKKDPANAGLSKAQEFLEPIKKKFKKLSYADLWVLASYVAIEEMGGPKIEFTPGRSDAKDGKNSPPNGRLPDAKQGAQHIRDVFYRMGFSDREIVVLVGGGHGIGRCHTDRSGYDGPWSFAPTKFGNMFFYNLEKLSWKERQWSGPKQFEDNSKKLMMLPADMALLEDKDFKKWSSLYAEDRNQFNADFAAAFKKLTELGFVKGK